MTTVISVRGQKRHNLESDPNFVYVARSVRYTTWDQSSKWANKFSVARYGDRAVELFNIDLIRHIQDKPEILDILKGELKGKTLGCWCGKWRPGDPDIGCHAVILAKLADGEILCQ